MSPLTLFGCEPVNKLQTHMHIHVRTHLAFCVPLWNHPCILSFTPSPRRYSTLFPFISTSLPSSTAFTLPLTGRAAVDDTYPAESSHAGSMDCGTLRGEIAPQASPLCVLSQRVCVCARVRVYARLFIQCTPQPPHLHQWYHSHSVQKQCIHAHV